MSTAAILSAIWPTLRGFLTRIGRWLLDVLLVDGRRGLALYMRQRIRVFEIKRGRSAHKRRKKWLTGRIGRWRKAATWLESAQAAKLTKQVARRAQKLAESQLDEIEPELENFARWNRRELRRARRRARRAG